MRLILLSFVILQFCFACDCSYAGSRNEPKPTTSSEEHNRYQLGMEYVYGFEAAGRFKKLPGANESRGIAFAGIYRPSALSLMLTYKGQYRRGAKHNERKEISQIHESSKVALHAGYDWVLIDREPEFLGQLQMMLGAGVLRGYHAIELGESDATVSDNSTTWGVSAVAEGRLSLSKWAWIVLRQSHETYRLRLSKFDFNEYVYEINTALGLRFAF